MNKVRKNKILLIVIGIIGVLVFILLFSNINTRIIHYKTGSSVYDIKVRKYNLYVKVSEDVYCFKAPCDRVESSFIVKYKNEYHSLMNKLFKDNSTKEITITESDLNSDDMEILSDIIKQNK